MTEATPLASERALALSAGRMVLKGQGNGTYDEACEAIRLLSAALSASPAPSGQAEDHSSLRYQIRWSRPGDAEELVCSDLTMRVCFARIMQAAKNNGGVMVHAIVPSAPSRTVPVTLACERTPAPSGQGVSGEVRKVAQALLIARTWPKHSDNCAYRTIPESEDGPWLDCNCDLVRNHKLIDDALAIVEALAAPAPSCAPGEVERLRAALKPFLHVAEPIVHNDKERWNPDEWHSRMNSLTVGQFRALHAAALSPQGLDAKEGEQIAAKAHEHVRLGDYRAGYLAMCEAYGKLSATPSQRLDAKEGGE